MALDQALAARRSVRSFAPTPLSEDELARLLWAAQGVTDESGRRTAPSAGARYPLELHVVRAAGVARYRPATGELEPERPGDRRHQLSDAALEQDAIAQAPATIVIAAVFGRVESKYGPNRGPRYVLLEAGAACENLLLEAAALGLGAVMIGAFDDRRVQAIIGLGHDERPLVLVPVGHPG